MEKLITANDKKISWFPIVRRCYDHQQFQTSLNKRSNYSKYPLQVK